MIKITMVYLIGCNVLNGPEGAVMVRHIIQQSRAREDIKRSLEDGIGYEEFGIRPPEGSH